MESYTFSADTKLEAINQAKKTLVETENNLIIKEIENSNNNQDVTIKVVEKREVINFIKDYIKRLLINIGYNEINIEIQNKDTTPIFTIYSDNDSLLIGKSGKNLRALQIIVQQAIKNELDESFKFVININDYKEKREKSLIKLAHNIATEVKTSKISAKLDSMNSYERRIIHNALLHNKDVYTESEGEEPNRYVVIKPKEDK